MKLLLDHLPEPRWDGIEPTHGVESDVINPTNEEHRCKRS